MNKRFLLWAVLSTLLMVGVLLLKSKFHTPEQPTEEARPLEKAKAAESALMLAAGLGGGLPGGWFLPPDPTLPAIFQKQHQALAEARKAQEAREAEARMAAEKEGPPIVLGDGPGFKIRAEFSTRGGAMKRVTLKDYRAASPDYAQPLDQELVLLSDDDDGKLATAPVKEQLERQSFRFIVEGSQIQWSVKEPPTPTRVAFVGEVPGTGVTVTRTFELQPGSYHLDMNISMQFGPKARDEFIYKLTGPRGVPVEAKAWQRMSYRQIVVGTVDAKDGSSPTRAPLISAETVREGKAENIRLGGERQELQFAGTTAQYFAALVVVAEDPSKAHYIDSVVPEYYGPDAEFPPAAEKLMGKIGPTLISRPMPSVPGKVIEHKFLLYTGPSKVRLLNYETGVAAGLPDRYEHDLHLNLLTDAPTYKLFGYIGWTGLVVTFTNLMHWLLHYLFAFAHNYGLAIILLTLIVRVCLFPISRRQALASQRSQQKMAALKPELEKLKEKYKDDRQALGMAQMELMKKHGVLMAPMKGCLPLLLQMPIMTGLYYALYESIDLRFAGFLWMDNLAVPDALWNWKDVPFLGGLTDFLRLGPTFNLLPLISVTIMFIQQKWMMPPPADEQQAAQMKMMKYMPIFMAWMFYWVPAGLCVYFIVSGAWGLLERKLLPKISHEKAKTETTTAPVAAGRARAKPSSNGNRNGTPSVFGKLAEWWQEMLKRAEKK
jgi:YidC/Oxa1 family membrane protein insertase